MGFIVTVVFGLACIGFIIYEQLQYRRCFKCRKVIWKYKKSQLYSLLEHTCPHCNYRWIPYKGDLKRRGFFSFEVGDYHIGDGNDGGDGDNGGDGGD